MIKIDAAVVSLPERNQGFAPLIGLLAWALVIQNFLGGAHSAGAGIPEFWWLWLGASAATFFMLGLLIPINLRRARLSESDLGFSGKISRRALVWGIGGGATLYFFHHAASLFVERLVGGVANAGAVAALEKGQLSHWFEWAGLAWSIVVMTPIIEELTNRAILISWLKLSFGEGRGRELVYAIVSGVVFALTHDLGHPLYSLVYAASGFGFALIYMRSRSLGAAIIAHSTLNLLAIGTAALGIR